MLTLERAKELNDTMVTEPHLKVHALSVSAAIRAMGQHFDEDAEHWAAVGYLHDYDYEKYPEEHLQHTAEPLRAAGVDEDEIHELTGIIGACARMRPNVIEDLEVSSFMKKFKNKKFAAKCNRELIKSGCAMLGMDVKDVVALCIEGMKPYAKELGLEGTEHSEG